MLRLRVLLRLLRLRLLLSEHYLSTSVRLIVGLGNPGLEYAKTRHNAGAWYVEALARQKGVSLKQETKFQGLCAQVTFHPHRCTLLIPTTFMNHSGRSVSSAAAFYKCAPCEILVVHDELDFSPGQVRLKIGGGHGGHNGLRDVITQLGSADFIRLRLGIGHPGDKKQVLSYVLGRPSPLDQERIGYAISESLVVMDDIVNAQFEKAQCYLHASEE